VVIANGSIFVEIAFAEGVRLQVPRYIPNPPSKQISRQIAQQLDLMGRNNTRDVSGLKVRSVVDDHEYGIGQVSAIDKQSLTVDFAARGSVKITKPLTARTFLHLWGRTLGQVLEDIRNAPSRVKLLELVSVARTEAGTPTDIRSLLPEREESAGVDAFRQPGTLEREPSSPRSGPAGQKWAFNRWNRAGF
jgi:hypothetical protein